MIILTLRTDKPEAELGIYDDTTLLANYHWLAHHELAETLLEVIRTQLANEELTIHEVQGIGVFKGPGSFTGLRIGITVANALAEGVDCPIVGEEDDDWAARCITRLMQLEDDGIVKPSYGSDPHITAPKK
jgi:tRNA threonylcarbamoyladenosine biosynthesis protein TsaB